ncbi:hypothetical protein NDR87_30080 [Nocardia sp. CDC159]|uniref:Uncharacterized protein n=1 Tax=Nocardia pulmonis TaxID=2951408 RepID=A0A9X2ECC4_9NOCA|nr:MULTISPECIES: hypothetical protein [Nocardia]MCM6777741.1 hypothetical protein [Nocardia pulmonis]MCM6790626.1 hypothetical protein [Nocardia sp. CDC159]
MSTRSRFTPRGRKLARYELRTRYGGAPGYVPFEPIRDHIASLNALGLPCASIARDAGCTADCVVDIRHGRWATVRIRQATAIMAVTYHPNERQGLVLALGAIRRLRALYRIGWTWVALSEQTGLTQSNLSQLTRPGRLRTLIPWDTWVAVRDAYERLSGTPGTRGRAKLARREAQDRGWPAPLDWDGLDIDDPRVVVQPSGPAQITARTVARDRRERVKEQMRRDLTARQIAERVGISERQVLRYLAELRKHTA